MPKLFLERLQGKRHPAFSQRLGFSLPTPDRETVIWIHAVSVGEVKSAAPFFQILKKKFPDAWFCVTTTTFTGRDEAKRSLLGADAYLYFPLDFSFSSRRFVTKIRPNLFFQVESDFWPHLIKEVRRRGGKAFLISGKLSIRAASRWKYFSFFAKRLFSSYDYLCVQTEEYRSRFLSFQVDPAKISVTGNLKLDMEAETAPSLSFVKSHPFLTISCTHAPEEDLLLEKLKRGPWTIFLAPRHPQRFEEVAELLVKKNISFIRWKDRSQWSNQKVILVDAMGQLAACYSSSKVALVGGSFVPKIGGHNVLEPCLYGCPSLFGPYTYSQTASVNQLLESAAGMQKSLDDLEESVQEILLHHKEYSQNAHKMVAKSRGSAASTWQAIAPILEKN